MRRWKTAAWTAALLARGAGAGAAIGPTVHGQTAAVRRETPRVVQFSGGGSWIGLSVRDLGDEDVAKTKLPAPGGVLVEEVSTESPAQTAGVKAGDVIVEFDGERVRGTRQFTRLVQETPAGRKVQTSVVRDGQRVPLTIEPREGNGLRFFDGFDRFPDAARAWLEPMPPMPPVPPHRLRPRSLRRRPHRRRQGSAISSSTTCSTGRAAAGGSASRSSISSRSSPSTSGQRTACW